jgi:hypothetical protein
MNNKFVILLIISLRFSILNCFSQDDSLQISKQLHLKKYASGLEKKTDKYSARIRNKTEKTLIRLSRYENKVQLILKRVNPDAEKKLFANNEMTFAGLLDRYRKGENLLVRKRDIYDEYTDKLNVQLKFLKQKSQLLNDNSEKSLVQTQKTVETLQTDAANVQAIKKIIKERKKKLMEQAAKYLSNSKQLKKINKEAYYYAATLKNYKEIFEEPGRLEETAGELLKNNAAFQKFIEKNSMLSSIFPKPSNFGSIHALAGLQTRQSINSIIQGQIAVGGPGTRAVIQQNVQQAQGELNKLKQKILSAGGSDSNSEIPDFKPNQQKTKTFLQRLEYGFNLQFSKTNSLVPAGADIGLSIGYKLNDKSQAGVGVSYKLGIGSVERIRFSHEGLGLRSFIEWKLKKTFFVRGGIEMNYMSSFNRIEELKTFSSWQSSGLIGLSKKIPITNKFMKGTNFQIMYDLLHRQHIPATQAFIFRMGYTIK